MPAKQLGSAIEGREDLDAFDFGGTPPSRADARRNRDAVIDAARRAFAREGVGASLEDIAQEAGVGSATLHRHFPLREDLIASAIAEGMKATFDRGLELLNADGKSEALWEWVTQLVVQFSTYSGLPESINQAANERKSALGLSCAAIQDLNDRLVQQAKDVGAIRADITGDEIFTFVNAIAWTNSGGNASRAARALSLVFDGLRPRQAVADGSRDE